MKRSGFLRTLAVGVVAPKVLTNTNKKVSIEVKSISSLPVSEFMTPLEILEFYRKTGNILYRSV
jgi:hypothetical protein